MLRWCACLLLLSTMMFALADVKADPDRSGSNSAATLLPLTTSSAKASEDFERAMRYFEQYRHTETLQNLRLAVKDDPDFAQALILISHLSGDPAEQAATR